MLKIITIVSDWSIPLIILLIPAYGIIRKIPVYEAFVEGAKEGFTTAIRIIPYLVAMLVAVKVFQYSGAMQYLINLVSPLSRLFGIPDEVLPLVFVRPLSGSGSLGILANILTEYGPDSFIGRLASTIQGSTETTFYVLTVYLGAIGIRKVRHSLISSLAADIVGLLVSVIIVNLVFG